ncbi:universal stress protein, partial [Halobium palmae]
MAPSHVLVPLDGSPLAEAALSFALDTFDCRTTVLNVVTPLDESMSEGGVLTADDDRLSEARDRAETADADAMRRAADRDRTVET